jgi:hypothetical protein
MELLRFGWRIMVL